MFWFDVIVSSVTLKARKIVQLQEQANLKDSHEKLKRVCLAIIQSLNFLFCEFVFDLFGISQLYMLFVLDINVFSDRS